MTKPKRLKAPAYINGEALLEWERILDDLAEVGLTPDRATLILYVRTWATWRASDTMVIQYGPVIKYSNGVAGEAPFYKTWAKDGAKVLALLEAMGLTPAQRHKMASKQNDTTTNVPDINF